jgi:phosphatidylinositol glycan class O
MLYFEICCCSVQITERLIGLGGPGGVHEDTLLLVFGDHGQTMTGDHGGGSQEELDSVLLAVNLRAAASSRVASTAPKRTTSTDGGCTRDVSCEGLEESHASCRAQHPLLWPTVAQLDFAATVSALLGQPIPAENVGACILHL